MEPRIGPDFRFEYEIGSRTCHIDVRESDEGFAFGVIEAERGCAATRDDACLIPFSTKESRYSAKAYDFECDEPRVLADVLMTRLFSYAPDVPDTTTGRPSAEDGRLDCCAPKAIGCGVQR
jgi:hypothetical protein